MDKSTVIITDKIPIGISSCCMGSPVRYNGKGIDVRKDLTKMERTALEDSYLFGASPVIYRDARRVDKQNLERNEDSGE